MKIEFSVTVFCIRDHLTGPCNNVKEINSDNDMLNYVRISKQCIYIFQLSQGYPSPPIHSYFVAKNTIEI